MGIFDSFSTLLRSNINDLISRAEDPEKMLNQILIDMRSQLAKAKQQVAAAIADEKRLQDQADAECGQAAGLGAEARCSRSRKAATISPSRRSCGRASMPRTAQQLELTWEAHQPETEKLKESLRD